MKNSEMIDSVWVKTETAVESSSNLNPNCQDSPVPPKYSTGREMRKI